MVGTWKPFQKFAVATYFFTANGKFQLSLNIGDHLQIEEETDDWYKGYSIKSATSSKNRKGIFPKAYVKLVDSLVNATNDTDVVLNQIHQVMSEWGIMFKTCFKEGKMTQFHGLKERMTLLLEMRRQVMAPNTPPEVRETLKGKALDKIEEVRGLMGQDVTPKNAAGEIADESNTGVVALYHMYQQHEENSKKAQPKNLVRILSSPESSPVAMRRDGADKKVRKVARRDELRKSIAIVRTQLIGAPAQSVDDVEAGSEVRVATHILLDLKILMCPVGDPTELYFSLYNATTNLFVSEEYQVKMTGQGMPQDLNKLGKLKTIFTDVNQRELQNGDIYLVLKLMRKARPFSDTSDSKNQKPNAVSFKRPFGVGVFSLGSKGGDPALVLGKEVEHTLPVFAAANESLFATLHDLIIKNGFQVTKNGPLVDIPNSKGAVLGLTLLQGELSSLAIPDGASPTSRLTLPDTPSLSFTRNELYFTLLSGEFIKDKTASNKNVQVMLSLRDNNGELHADAIYEGSTTGSSEVDSLVLLHNNSPTWNQIFSFKFPVPGPLDLLKDKWICLQMFHCAEKGKEKEEFAQGFLRLSKDDGTAIDDGVHSVNSFKPLPVLVPKYSLQEEAKINLRKGEVIKLRVQLASTFLTSNSFVFQLLRWKNHNSSLEDILKKFIYIEPAEITKFMRDIFDALFEIMESREELVFLGFDAFVFVVGLGPKIAAVLDQYLSQHFKWPNVHKRLLHCLKHYLSTSADSHSKIITTLKSVAYIFRFIIASRVLFNKVQQVDDAEVLTTTIQTQSKDDTFKKDLLDVFDMINGIMKNTSPQMRGPQSTALKNISSIFGDLARLFTPAELSTIISQFINSVQYSPQLELLNKDKLMLINRLVCSPFFLEPDALDILLPSILTQLGIHLRGSNHEEILQCVLILSVITNTFQTKIKVDSCVQQVLEQLPAVMGAVRALRDEADIAGEPFICLLAMLKLPSSAAFETHLATIGSWEAQRTFLLDLFTLLYEMMSGTPRLSSASNADVLLLPESTTPFPPRWLFMNMAAYGIVLKLLDHMSEYLVKKYSTEATYAPSKPLWERVLALALMFLRARPLAVESFPPIKRNLVLERYSDMRQPMSQVLLRLWDALSPTDQMTFLNELVGPALHLFMMEPSFLQDAGVRLYYGLLQVEVAQTGTIRVVEALTIDTLDACAFDSTLPQNFNNFFVAKLELKFKDRSDVLATKGKKFIVDITYLLDLLADLSSLPQTSIYEEERIDAIVKLMDYLKATGRTSSYLKYVHMLESIHAASGNFGEAGHTILLHAQLLKFDDELVDPVGVFPRETARHRKERLYKVAMDYFDKGKLWEEAIKLIKELRIEYEFTLYDYMKLADILDLQATLVRKISTIERFFPDYFRVGYYGKGFDAKYQNKVFIFRGNELEGRSEFVPRIQARFPNSTLLAYTELPPDDIINSKDQHIQVFLVKTTLDTDETINPNMPGNIARFYQWHNRKMFMYSKPFRKNKEKSQNEFKDLWLRNSVYHTAEKLPSTHRRTEVMRLEVIEVSPVNCAVGQVEGKNFELIEMNRKYDVGADENNAKNFSPYTMILKGSIDAGVNGGVERYNDAFFEPNFVKENPDDAPTVRRLKDSLVAHVALLEKGLAVHARMCGPSLAPLQEQLEKQFVKMKQDVLSYAK